MNRLDTLLIRARDALQTLSVNQQQDLVEFIEQYASHFEGREIYSFEQLETEIENVKKIN